VCVCAYGRDVMRVSDTLSVSGRTMSFMRVLSSRLACVCCVCERKRECVYVCVVCHV